MIVRKNLIIKMTVTQMPRKTQMSVFKVRHCKSQLRRPITSVIYGSVLLLLGILTVVVDPLDLFTNWFLEIEEGSFVYNMWERPTYNLYSEVWIFNYTNAPQYLRKEDTVLKLEQIGPFVFKETRTNRNITINKENGTMTIIPNTAMSFDREQSIADTKDVKLYVPNIALLALSTVAADQLNFIGNGGIYYSTITLGSKLFLNLSAEEYFWGYDDPLVTLANKFLPGWIDFKRIGILDRFYAAKAVEAVVELKDSRTRFSIKKWGNSEGLKEQGFTDYNTSNLCNRIKGTYEGLMLPPKFSKERMIPVFKKQACKVYPFIFQRELSDYGFKYYRYAMEQSAFSKSSPYSCECSRNCLPEGFIDVSNCYYGFPIALSKPHFQDADPKYLADFEGLTPDPNKLNSIFDIEPTVGVPMKLECNIQVNIAVRMSSANPVTKPVQNKILPLIWVSMYCKMPPPQIILLLRLRLIIAPILFIIIELLLFVFGLTLGINGFYRMRRQNLKTNAKDSIEKGLENVSLEDRNLLSYRQRVFHAL